MIFDLTTSEPVNYFSTWLKIYDLGFRVGFGLRFESLGCMAEGIACDTFETLDLKMS